MTLKQFLEYSRRRSRPTKPVTSSASEPLTKSEIESLRRDKKRISAYARKVFADFAPKAD